MPTSHEEQFAKITARFEASGGRFRFQARLAPYEAGIDGAFWHGQARTGGHPKIVVYREHYEHSGDALEELLTLAHEYGHFLSDVAGHRTTRLRELGDVLEAQWSELPEDDKHLVFAEEERAWAFARAVLADVGFDNWTAFETRVAASLAIYMERLGVPPLPDENTATNGC